MKIDLVALGFEYVQEILEIYACAGYNAYVVGGFVRDLLLGRPPKDIDIATNSPLCFTMSQFKTYDIGRNKEFGIVVIQYRAYTIEVAQFRHDGIYTDGRHPDEVVFVDSIEADLLRRDFTVNALALDSEGNILDIGEGQKDLSHRIIRFLGTPEERIAEDKLRMLRAIRFAVKLDFAIEPLSFHAIKEHVHEIHTVSIERIQTELVQIFMCNTPSKALSLLWDTGLLHEVLPILDATKTTKHSIKWHPEGAVVQKILDMGLLDDAISYDSDNPEHLDSEKYVLCPGTVYDHICRVLDNTPACLELRFAALLHDIGKPHTFKLQGNKPTFHDHATVGAQMTNTLLKSLKFSNTFRETVVWLVQNHMKFLSIKRMKRSTLIKFFKQPHYSLLLQLHFADAVGSSGDISDYKFALQKYEELKPNILSAPILNGDDLVNFGLTPSPLFKYILRDVEEKYLNGELQSREDALHYVQIAFVLS